MTGAAGFIGRSIAAALLQRGERVRGVDNFLTGRRENLIGLEAMEFLEGDLIDPEICQRACAGVEIIFHEAGLASVPRSISDPVTIHRNCADITFCLLVAARSAGVRRVIYAGSSSVYGNAAAVPLHEDMEPNPISPYAAAKLAGEHYMRAFHRIYGLESVVLRYFNVFGPYQNPASQHSGVLAVFSRKMLAGEQPTIYDDGEQSRDFTYIDNVVDANLLAAAAPAARVAGRVVNIGAGRRITLNDAFYILRRLTGYRGEPAYAPPRAGDIRDSQADIGRSGELFSYAPRVDFEEGLRRTVAWRRIDQIREGQMAENSTRLAIAV